MSHVEFKLKNEESLIISLEKNGNEEFYEVVSEIETAIKNGQSFMEFEEYAINIDQIVYFKPVETKNTQTKKVQTQDDINKIVNQLEIDGKLPSINENIKDLQMPIIKPISSPEFLK